MMWDSGYGGVGWLLGGGLMMGMMLLVWLAPIALVAWGVASARGGRGAAAPGEAPLEILRRRYASGEISQAEYEQAKQALA